MRGWEPPGLTRGCAGHPDTQVVTQPHTRLVAACAAGPVVTQKHPGTRIPLSFQVADTLRHFLPFDSFPLAVFKS